MRLFLFLVCLIHYMYFKLANKLFLHRESLKLYIIKFRYVSK
jgi:hypothetical protein